MPRDAAALKTDPPFRRTVYLVLPAYNGAPNLPPLLEGVEPFRR